MADLPDNSALCPPWPDPPMSPSQVTAYVGERIALARERAGLSQRDLARILGVRQQTISHWEAGQRDMELRQLVAVAHALRAPVATLLPARAEDVPELRRWLDRLERG